MSFQPTEIRGQDTQELADRLIRAIEKWDADVAFVDNGAMGQGVVDAARARGYGSIVRGVMFGSNAASPEKYENKRAEMYWEAAEWVKQGGCLPQDFMLSQELSAPKYWYDKKQRVCLEPKKDIKSRLGRSPDRADGFVLTFAGTVVPKQRGLQMPGSQAGRQGTAVHEYDPV